MTERTVPKEFNDANIRVAREFKAERDVLIEALRDIIAISDCHYAAARAHTALAQVNAPVGNAGKP